MKKSFNYEIIGTRGDNQVVVAQFFAQNQDVASKIVRAFVKSITAKTVNDHAYPLSRDMFKLYPVNTKELVKS